MFANKQSNRNLIKSIPFIFILGLLLAACGSETPEPQAEPENSSEPKPTEANEAEVEEIVPTEEAEPTLEPEPTEAPTEIPAEIPTEVPTEEPEAVMAEFEGTTFKSAADGYSLVIPDGYEAIQQGKDVIVPEIEDDPEAYILFSSDIETEGEDLITFVTNMMSNILGESGSMGEPSPISINGVDGQSVLFEVEEDGMTIKGSLISLEVETHAVMMFGGGSADYWDSTLEAVFNQIANSIELTAPDASGAEGENSGDDTADSAGSTDEVSLPAVSATGVSGTACMAGKNVGLSCIKPDGSWSYYDMSNSDLSSNFILAMTTCSDNQIAISASGKINLFDGSNFEIIEGDWGYSSADELACDAAGNIWAIYFDGAAFYDGTSWTVFEYADFANDDSSLVSDVAISDDGTAWILTSNSISAYKDGAWTVYEEGNGLDEQYFFNNLAIDSNGQPIASMGDGFLTFDGTSWSEVEADSYYGLNDLITSNNLVWFETYNDGLVQYDGANFTVLDRGNGLSSNSINGAQIDASGRLWVATDYGINILDADGSQAFTMANSGIADQRVDHVAVLGDGPALPETVEKGAGSISGSVVFEDGTPLADARVEVCAEGLSFGFTDTPCSEQVLFYQTTTDADGNFSFDDVTVSYYATVIEVAPDEWAQVVGELGFLAERLLVTEGENTDIGEITIEQDDE